MNVNILTAILVIFMAHSSNGIDGRINLAYRDEWGAKSPQGNLPIQQGPASKVIIIHTATGECEDLTSCAVKLRAIQNDQMNRGFADISYNFLIGGDAMQFEGRGWRKEGQHTKNHNGDSIGIAFIGNFQSKAPNQGLLLALKFLIEESIYRGHLSPNYKLYGHRQLMDTLSPGNKLYEIIKTWPHWSSTV